MALLAPLHPSESAAVFLMLIGDEEGVDAAICKIESELSFVTSPGESDSLHRGETMVVTEFVWWRDMHYTTASSIISDQLSYQISFWAQQRMDDQVYRSQSIHVCCAANGKQG